MDKSELEQKQQIVEAAIEVYLEDRPHFSMGRIAAQAQLERADIYRHFPSKKAILKYYYYLCVLRYEAMVDEIEAFADFDLAEKFSNFVYTLFELLGEEREFVEETFEELICRNTGKSQFLRQVEEVFAGFLAQSGALPIAEKAVPLLAREYLWLVRHWLDDDSQGAEQTLALADKGIAFGAEALESRLLAKGLDLAKFLVNDKLPGFDADGLLRRIKAGWR